MENNTFVFDILSQVLKYKNNNVSTVFNDKDQPWFKLSDLLNLLGYTSIIKQPAMLDISEKNERLYRTMGIHNILSKDIIKSRSNTYFVNKLGLYEVLSISRKHIAINFRSEIFNNILFT